MKKNILFILIGLLFLACSVPTGFAFFYFNNSSKINDIETSVDNASFNEVNNETYKIYFFASPYYATGAELDGTNTEDDPLVIAESENNPYIDDTDYGIMRTSGLDAGHDKYANVRFRKSYPDGDVKDRYYISCENVDNDHLEEGKGGLTLYKKKDFSGFIRPNSKFGINEKEYKYFSINVSKNISSDVLNNVIANTVFKDGYGFGPEFVGWTYDKTVSKQRAMNGTDRYIDGSKIKSDSLGVWKQCDSRGYGINSKPTPYLIGNYGVQGAIEQITSSTSLYYIDNLGNGTDNDTAVDGSKIGDHIIYLYPVFAAKNYNSFSSATPLLKFRINPDGKDSDGYNIYGYNQNGEIDYSKNRYTASLFQTMTTTNSTYNYYIDDIYIDTTQTSQIKKMQLDVAPPSGANSDGWADAWTTIISFDDLKKLNLEKGYYNVEVYFFIPPSSNPNEDSYTKRVTNKYNEFKATNKYTAVYGSKRNKDDTDNFGITWLDKNEITNLKSIPSYYVVGFTKVRDYHLTSERLNGSINDYSANGYKNLFTSSLANNYKQYYQVEKVTLHKDEELAILNGVNSADNLTYTFNKMSSDDITTFNDALTSSSHSDKTGYNVITDNTDITVSENRIISKKESNYSLLFNMTYENGEVKNINVAFKENSNKFAFVVLKSKPTSSSNIYYDYNDLFDSNLVSYAYEANKGEVMDDNTILYTSLEVDANDVSGITISQLFNNNSNKKLIDTATGWEINKNLFANNKFQLNRNYVVYFA